MMQVALFGLMALWFTAALSRLAAGTMESQNVMAAKVELARTAVAACACPSMCETALFA
jgi:hypothetical protein